MTGWSHLPTYPMCMRGGRVWWGWPELSGSVSPPPAPAPLLCTPLSPGSVYSDLTPWCPDPDHGLLSTLMSSAQNTGSFIVIVWFLGHPTHAKLYLLLIDSSSAQSCGVVTDGMLQWWDGRSTLRVNTRNCFPVSIMVVAFIAQTQIFHWDEKYNFHFMLNIIIQYYQWQ